jgi:hypothetical protein
MFMEISENELQRIELMAKALLDAVSAIRQPLVVPDDVRLRVDQAVESRVCLGCGGHFPRPERYTKGRCGGCYATLIKRIERGQLTKREAIVSGQLAADSQSPGRKAKMDAKRDVDALTKFVEDSRKDGPK